VLYYVQGSIPKERDRGCSFPTGDERSSIVSIVGRIWSFVASLFARTARQDPDEVDTGQPLQGMYLERRYEIRLASTKFCQVSLMHSLNSGSVVFQEWTSVTVNQSESGMLVWAPSALPPGKLLEVAIEETARTHSVSLVEVQWSQLVRYTAEGQLHLVGCRKTFPSYQYVAF